MKGMRLIMDGPRVHHTSEVSQTRENTLSHIIFNVFHLSRATVLPCGRNRESVRQETDSGTGRDEHRHDTPASLVACRGLLWTARLNHHQLTKFTSLILFPVMPSSVILSSTPLFFHQAPFSFCIGGRAYFQSLDWLGISLDGLIDLQSARLQESSIVTAQEIIFRTSFFIVQNRRNVAWLRRTAKWYPAGMLSMLSGLLPVRRLFCFALGHYLQK